MNKIITISTLTAGIGVSTLGLNANHADAAEYNHNPVPQQHSQYGYHHQSYGQFMPQDHQNYNNNGQWHPQLNHYQPSGYQQHFQQQSFSNTQSASNTTSSTSNSSSNDITSSSRASSTTTSTSTQTTSSTSGNLYTSGQCTWYVYDKVGGKIGSTWGNANNWASAAQAAGYTVNNTPAKGSILQTTQGSMGHVAYVESVNSDGSITISEMNYTGGPYVVDTRTISSSQASSYNYIHLS
ncbi:CHAP domain-containing protein [Staphylococcus croceilyticus]|uniref:CHAP domain-containing protein n=1 Tax=Staphylococcus croceilyticus TaxID=319942 RepID=A0ABY2KAD3_9STAP|nr:CHAP domain-containing protein [Staphylococcus croceilyticus]PNZ65993.1 CHAP domain-containing protein [Staphylococcus croceilyticus]TGA73109.1 CHAP domain-containing protein [Staphylococcus croceilyticus]